jgi:hypothetical protein
MVATMKPDQQLELLRSCVALRVQARQVRESVRVGLASIEAGLAAQAGPLVRKTVAAKLLGVSVQGLDRHVAKGTIPTEPIAEDSVRTAIPTTELLDIAYEQALGERTLGGAIIAARERRWRDIEVGNAHRLIHFATGIEVAAWKKRVGA